MRTDYSQAIVTCVYARQGIVAHIVHHDGAPSRKRQRTIENQDDIRSDGGALYNPYLPNTPQQRHAALPGGNPTASILYPDPGRPYSPSSYTTLPAQMVYFTFP